MIKWKGFPDTENTWEPASSILDYGLIQAFLEQHPNEQRPILEHMSDMDDDSDISSHGSNEDSDHDSDVDADAADSDGDSDNDSDSDEEFLITNKRRPTRSIPTRRNAHEPLQELLDEPRRRVSVQRNRFTEADEQELQRPLAQVMGQPKGIQGNMRDYQVEGLRWLVSQYDTGAGGILGDEMGLGKTLQVTAMLCFLKEERNEPGPHLIVCPLSVLPTWISELQRWCPSLSAIGMR